MLNGGSAPYHKQMRPKNPVIWRFWLVCAPLAILTSGCSELSTRELSNRCETMYLKAAEDLSRAAQSLQQGDALDAVNARYSARFDERLEAVRKLRADLARGGEKHRWPWPPRIRSKAQSRYSAMNHRITVAVYVDSTVDYAGKPFPISSSAIGELKKLRWFYNRAVSATMKPLKKKKYSERTLLDRMEEGYMGGSSLEILEAMETREELEAYTAYRMEYYGSL